MIPEQTFVATSQIETEPSAANALVDSSAQMGFVILSRTTF
jgi:hypothetical protein